MRVGIILSGILLLGTLVNAGTVRYYRFETNNGSPVSNGQTMTVADDSSGNNLNGVPHGSPQYATTPFASTVPQTGAPNSYSYLGSGGGLPYNPEAGIFLSGSTVPILSSTFTVEALFRLTSTNPNTGDVKPILRVEDPTTGTGFFTLEFLNANGNGGTNDLLVEMSNDSLELYDFDVSANTNHSVAVTDNGTTVSLYVDGALIDSTSFSSFSGSGTANAAIGNAVTFSGGAFQGNIDEVRISNDALAPSQFLDAVVPVPSALPAGMGLIGLLAWRRAARDRPYC